MTIRYLLIAVSYLFAVLIITSIPIRTKEIEKKTGECKLGIKNKAKVINLPVLFLCLVLIAILFFRDLGIFMNIVVCLTALLGTYMISRIMIFDKKKGIYEKGIITTDQFISFSEIVSIPSFEWEERNSSDSFDVITKKHGTVTVLFPSAEECQKAEKLIVQFEPRLK